MTKYSVWMSGGEGAQRVHLPESDDAESAAELVKSLIGFMGQPSFDVGVSILQTEEAPSHEVPAAQAKPAEPPTPAPTPRGRPGR